MGDSEPRMRSEAARAEPMPKNVSEQARSKAQIVGGDPWGMEVCLGWAVLRRRVCESRDAAALAPTNNSYHKSRSKARVG